MKYITELQKQIPVEAECDVLVLGSGPAGVSAAICAAREGAKTILVEQGGDVRRNCDSRTDESLDRQYRRRIL